MEENQQLREEKGDEDNLSYEERLASSIKVIEGCFKLLEHNARQTLEARGRKTFRGDLKIEHDVTTVAYFDETNRHAWPADVKQMMTLSASSFFLDQYRELEMPVDTICVKVGLDIIGRVIIPCAPKTQ